MKLQRKTPAKQSREDMAEMMKNRFMEQHPELHSDDPEEQERAVAEYFAGKEYKRLKNLKEHLAFFTDGVVAIIITVMVLSIPLPIHGEASYPEFLKAVGIFFLSFFIVASFWYGHHQTLIETETVSQRVMIINMAFLAVLSVIPILTKWMIADTCSLAVMHYGIAYLLISLVQSTLLWRVHKEMSDGHMADPRIRKFMWVRLGMTLTLNVALIVLAWWLPFAALVLYIALPLSGFISQIIFSHRQEQDSRM